MLGTIPTPLAKNHAEFPEPESTALQLSITLMKVIHQRLNYWLLTESALLAVLSAVLGLELIPEKSWLIIFALSIFGMFLTAFWHTTLCRSQVWYDWYFSRLQSIHRMRYGRPNGKLDQTSLAVFPNEREFKFLNGEGLGLSIGAPFLSIAFFCIWIIIYTISASYAFTMSDWSYSLLISTGILLAFVYVASVIAYYLARVVRLHR